MEWYEPEVRALEQRRAGYPTPPGAVLFYGSSSIRLWDTLAEDFAAIQPINLGFGGSTLEACAWFLQRLVVPYAPRTLVVYAGDNDLGDGKPPEQVLGYFRALVTQLDQSLPNTMLAFLSIKPSPARQYLIDQIRLTNRLIRRELDERPHSYYIDLFQPMMNGDGRPLPNLYAEDGLHLSAEGYQMWREIIALYAPTLFAEGQ
ncbi:MAG: GDSL family lipase [Chloroflexaceae bacterium]|nr:GDSL family lipase [Chloroflexaceae bacterium]NJO06495.1 GDSL family lipase [Chloroflexaceae bacterium]